MPEPEYVETPNTVKLILRNNIDERAVQENKTSSNPSNDVLSDVLNDALNEDEKRLLELIIKAPGATQDWYSKESGFSIAKVQRMMKKMKEQGTIYRLGAKKNGSWKVAGVNDKNRLF